MTPMFGGCTDPDNRRCKCPACEEVWNEPDDVHWNASLHPADPKRPNEVAIQIRVGRVDGRARVH